MNLAGDTGVTPMTQLLKSFLDQVGWDAYTYFTVLAQCEAHNFTGVIVLHGEDVERYKQETFSQEVINNPAYGALPNQGLPVPPKDVFRYLTSEWYSPHFIK